MGVPPQVLLMRADGHAGFCAMSQGKRNIEGRELSDVQGCTRSTSPRATSAGWAADGLFDLEVADERVIARGYLGIGIVHTIDVAGRTPHSELHVRLT